MGKKQKLLEKLFALPPEMRYEDVEKVLVAFGFECVRSKGSHQQFRHPGGRMLTVPKRGGQTVTRTYLKQVIAALECVTGKTLEELMEEE